MLRVEYNCQIFPAETLTLLQIEQELNKLGKEGWQLTHGTNPPLYMFVRPLPVERERKEITLFFGQEEEVDDGGRGSQEGSEDAP